MSSKCAQVGHGFRIEKETKTQKWERCEDCGFSAVFDIKGWETDKEYGKAHRRDFIQPNDPLFFVAYPHLKIVDSPERKREMAQMLTENVGKKRMEKVATEYYVNYGGKAPMDTVLKWHLYKSEN